MRLDGFGILVEDMAKMIRFYRDVLGFEIKETEDTSNVYLVKDGTLFLLYGRKDFETMTHRKYEYVKGLNGHYEIAMYVDTFDEVDEAFKKLWQTVQRLFLNQNSSHGDREPAISLTLKETSLKLVHGTNRMKKRICKL